MGGLFGGTTKTTQTDEPWKPQGDALKAAFSSAGDLYNQKKNTSWYTGDLYSKMDPQTAAAIQSMLGHNNGQGTDGANAISDAGMQLVNPGAFTGAIDRFSASAGADPTQANIDAARAYANNPAVDGMIDAASRDIKRNLSEVQLPGIDQAATAGGNVNNTRAGIAQGIAMRGAQDQIGDISSNIRGEMYDRGLSLAEQARQANMGAQGTAAGLYGDAMSTGAGFIGSGNDMFNNNMSNNINASALYQQDKQGQMDADLQRWQANDTRAQDLLDRYYGVIGANDWGGTTTTTQKTSGNILGKVLGGVSSLAGLGSGLGLIGGGGGLFKSASGLIKKNPGGIF